MHARTHTRTHAPIHARTHTCTHRHTTISWSLEFCPDYLGEPASES